MALTDTEKYLFWRQTSFSAAVPLSHPKCTHGSWTGWFSFRVLASDLCTGPDQCGTAGQIRSTLSVSALLSLSFPTPAVGGTVPNPPFPAIPHSSDRQWLHSYFWRAYALYTYRISRGVGGGEKQKWRFRGVDVQFQIFLLVDDIFANQGCCRGGGRGW